MASLNRYQDFVCPVHKRTIRLKRPPEPFPFKAFHYCPLCRKSYRVPIDQQQLLRARSKQATFNSLPRILPLTISKTTKKMSEARETQTTGGAEEQTGPNDLVQAVDKLLNEVGPRFQKVSEEIFAKMDEMAQRLDEMEAAIKAGNDAGTGGE